MPNAVPVPSPLGIHGHPVGVPTPNNRKPGQDGVDLRHLCIGYLHGLVILPNPLRGGGPGDGDDLGHAGTPRDGQDPADGELRGRAALLGREGLELAHELEVDVEVFGVEAGHVVPNVVRRHVREGLYLAGENLTFTPS